MPKDILHGIPIFVLALLFLVVLVLQTVYARREPKSSPEATAERFVLKYPPRYSVLYAVLFAFSVAILIVFAVLKLDSVLFYVIGGVMIVFAAGELYGALRRQIAYADGKFSIRPEFGGEEECALAAIAEVGYKKSFAGETVRAFGGDGKLFEADRCYRNFGCLKALLTAKGLLKTDGEAESAAALDVATNDDASGAPESSGSADANESSARSDRL